MTEPDLPSFYNKTRDARKIIVVDLGFLGDSVHLVPALWELKRHYPAAQLHTLSAPLGAEVLKLVPCLHRVWDFPLGPPSPSWWQHWGLIHALRREKFDLAFNFSGADRTIFLTALTGARWRVAHPGGRHHFYNRWLVPNWAPRQPSELPVFEQRRQVLAACGLSLEEPRFDFAVPEIARKWAAKSIPDNSIHLSVNASGPLKEWPLRHWIELTRTLLAEDPQLTLVASGSARSREQARLKVFSTGVRNSRLKLLPPGLHIPQLAAVLERCRLHIGGDSGVLHLAMALGLPTVAIFRDYPAKTEWLPRGPEHQSLFATCPCLGQRKPPCNSRDEPACLAQITPKQVAACARLSRRDATRPVGQT